MTEDEAKTKWCPFAREASVPGGWNRAVGDFDSKCIGSACMAWRFNRAPRDVEIQWASSTGKALDDYPQELLVDGYCGLAGK